MSAIADFFVRLCQLSMQGGHFYLHYRVTFSILWSTTIIGTIFRQSFLFNNNNKNIEVLHSSNNFDFKYGHHRSIRAQTNDSNHSGELVFIRSPISPFFVI